MKKFPEVGELVVGTVVRVDKHGAFVRLEGYDGLEAFVHVSEISLKWVRNIRDYLREGQRAVLKVIRSSPESLQVDASLRRVSKKEANEKMIEWNRMQKTKRLLYILQERTGVDHTTLEEGLIKPAEARHVELYRLFEEISAGDQLPGWVNLPDNAKHELIELCRREIKRSVAVVKRTVKLYAGRSGVESIRKAAEEVMRLSRHGERVVITIIGAPKYLLRVEAEDAERAEALAEKALEKLKAVMSKLGGEADVIKEDEQKKR